METTEQANARLSRGGTPTKHMTAANRVDSVTDLTLSYNNQKHVDMAQLLVRKLTMTQNRSPDLVADSEGC